jgi:curved DNA-binding protein CbpA
MKMQAEQTTQQHELPYEDVQLEENERSPYEVLEVSEQATMKEIHSAYKRKSLQNHPDRTAGLGEEYRELAEKRMKEINAAYARLRKDNGQA